MTTLILLLAVAVFAFITYGTIKSKKALKESGKIIDRQSNFYTKKEKLFAKAEYDQLAELIKAEILGEEPSKAETANTGNSSPKKSRQKFANGTLTGGNIEISEDKDNKTMVFRTHGNNAWTAAFRQTEAQADGNTFVFSFESFKRTDRVADETTMNYVLTTVERAFLTIDPDTVFELREEEYKTTYH